MKKKRSLLDRFKNPLKVRKLLVPQKTSKKIWHRIRKYFHYALIIVVFIVAFSFAWFSKDLPTPDKIAKRSATQSTKIYDRTGEILLYETGEQIRTIVRNDQISDNLKNATIAIEDENFKHHHGFDLRGLAAAIWQKISHRTTRTRGASTITQQYVKNALLDSNRTLTRKIKELILAIELEAMYSKDEILTMYLNEIPYGGNIAGAEAASKTYYGKPASELSISEAATLAAIPQSPTYYYPYGTHTEDLVYRKNYVLKRMVQTGYITQAQADEAKNQDSTTVGISLQQRKSSILAPHFAMYVIEQAAEEFGEEKIQKEGYKIITTLDYNNQKIAEDAISVGSAKLDKYNASNAALVSVDNNTGEIVAMVGSRNYFDTKIDGNVNVADSLRQPGSSFKPFAYATLFKNKEYSPSKILWDLQTDFGGGYIPKNYNGNYNGPVTIRTALSNSLNIPAVKALGIAGIDNVIRTASEMGITTLTDTDRYGLSLVLGAGEVKPVEMAGAFSVFATGGIKHDLKSIMKVYDNRGKLVYEYDKNNNKGRQVLDPQIAYEISDILSDNNARSMVFGRNSALHFPGKTIAAKTGTTSSFKDAWTVGYSKSIATAVWVGNNDSSAMKGGADGSVLAGPIFHIYMDQVVTANEPFDRPSKIQELTVEKYSNKLPSDLSQETTTDIFAEWQLPEGQDDVHVRVKVCKSNGLLASDNVSSDLTEERIYTKIVSEKPDNPNWENPVRAWANARGWNNSPPQDKCDVSNIPTSIIINSPSNGVDVSGPLVINATVSSSYSIKSVSFYIDDVSIGNDDSSPYEISYDFDNLTKGNHKITAIADDSNGGNVKTSIDINVTKDNVPPAISAINYEKINTTSYKISWVTDEPSMSQVIYDTLSKPSQPYDYSFKSLVDSNQVTSHEIIISVLESQKYYFRVISTDLSNNTSVSEPENSFSS